MLITGGGGFIGANLVQYYARNNYTVHVLSRHKDANWRLKNVGENYYLHSVNLQNYQDTIIAVKEISPSIVIHLATHGAYSKESGQREIFNTNVIGSLNLFRALQEVGKVSKIINFGSSSEYGKKNLPMQESDRLNPETVYGQAKSLQSMIAFYFSRNEEMPIFTLRPFSVYGPFEEPGRFMTDLMLALVRQTNLTLTSPDIVRDFVHVHDVRRACDLIISNKINFGGVFNIGGGHEYSLKEVIEISMRVTNVKLSFTINEKKMRSSEPLHWLADIRNAKKLLNWEPSMSLEAGVRDTFQWYKKYQSLYA